MPNISEINQELVRAFNINLRFNGIAITNLTVQNLYGKDHIVISFDKDMNSKQCMSYLSDLKNKIIKRSYKNEKAAGISYNLQSFPFAFHKSQLSRDSEGRSRFSVVIDEGVAYNLKCYLAQALAGNITVGIENRFKEHIYSANFDKSSYLFCMRFDDKRLQEYFVGSFSEDIEGYENAPSDYLEVDGNLVYIKKGIFDNIEFIKDIAAYNASLECRYLQTPSTQSKNVDKLKYKIIDFIDKAAGIPARTIIRTSYKGNDEGSVLIPLAQYNKFLELFTENDADNLNRAFGGDVVTKVESHRLKNPYWDSDHVYVIDFSDVNIACCVMDKIIENSAINKDYELTIDPELHFRALSSEPPFSPEKKSGILSSFRRRFSGSKSPLNSPIHESEPSGSGIKRQTPLTSSQRKELYSVLSPEMKKKLKSLRSPSDMENLLYLIYVDKRELRVLLTPEKEEIYQLELSQLAAGHPLIDELRNRNSQALSSSGYGSEPSPGSSPESSPGSSLDSVDLTGFGQQYQRGQKDPVH